MPNRSVKSAAIPVATPFSLILPTDGISLLRYAYPMLTLTTGPFAATLGSCATHGPPAKRISDNKITMIPKVGKVIPVMSQISAVALAYMSSSMYIHVYQSYLKSHRIRALVGRGTCKVICNRLASKLFQLRVLPLSQRCGCRGR